MMVIGAVLWAAGMMAAAGGAPGAAALSFLEALRSDRESAEEILKGTLISPFCGERKRGLIQKRLARLGARLREGDYELKEVAAKVDDPFAAVLVSMVSRSDPLVVDVIGLGLRKREDRWRVAPIPGSFENSNLGFDDAQRARAEALALWMGRERVGRLRDLQNERERAFRKQMAEAVPADLLRGAKPMQVMEAFMKACVERNLAAVMVLLGENGVDRSQEDLELQRVVSLGLRGLDRRNQWRRLTSPDVIRVLMDEDGGDDLDAEVVMLLFDPAGNPGTTLLRFVLLRSGKRWEIRLPGSLRLADADRQQFRQAFWRAHDPDDEELKRSFPKIYEKSREALRPKDPAAAGERIEAILREGTLDEFFRLLYRSKDLTDAERRVAYAELGKVWGDFRGGGKAVDGELLDVMDRGGAAVLVFHLVAIAQLGRPKLKPLVLMRDGDGWAIAPGVGTAGNFEALAEQARADQDAVLEAFHNRREALTRKAAERFLGRFVAATPEPGASIDPQEAAAVVADYRAKLRGGHLLEALPHCALLDDEDGVWEALQSLSYEYRGARHGKVADRKLGVATDGPWAAVSLRVDSGPSGVPDYPMYLVVATAAGPRIAIDAGLRLATNKARRALNAQVWTRIDEELGPEDAGLVRKLFDGHVERSKKDLAEWEKNHKSSP